MSDYLARVVAHGAEVPGAILPRPVAIFEAAPSNATPPIGHLHGDEPEATGLPTLAPAPHAPRREVRPVPSRKPGLGTATSGTPLLPSPRRLEPPITAPPTGGTRRPRIEDEVVTPRSTAPPAPEPRGTAPPPPRTTAFDSSPPQSVSSDRIVPPTVASPPVPHATLLTVPYTVASDHRPEVRRVPPPARRRSRAGEPGSASPVHQGAGAEPSRISPPRERPATPTEVVISRPPEWSRRDESVEPPASVPTIIQVTIGRVEVRASAPEGPTKRDRKGPPTVMSLDEYLKQRTGQGSQ